MGSGEPGVGDRIGTLRRLREKAKLGGGQERIEEQHRKGKLTARERLDLFLDPRSFVELDRFAMHRFHDFGMDQRRFFGDGVVTGYGTVEGRRVYVFSHDFTVFGGSLGEMFARKICKVMDLAMKAGCPIVGLNDSGGARIQEGVVSLGAYAEIFFRNVLASGVVPQISAVMGPCAGGAVYSPALTDFVLMVDKTSHMFITGPDVVRSVLDQEVTFEELGGASVHNRSSGVAHFLCSGDEDCLRTIKQLLSYIPSNNLDDPPIVDMGDDPNRAEVALSTIVPDDPDRSYDMKEVVTAVLDKDSFLEVHELWAPNIIVGFGRLMGDRWASSQTSQNSSPEPST